jgi:pimeloyl-ACP methyl ester carboxylesterase
MGPTVVPERKLGRLSLALISLLAACPVGLVGGLLIWSRRRVRPLLHSEGRPLPNSISEKIWVDINGVEQGMFIESQNDANPVLLVVHGGPGMPDHFLTKRYPTGLEEFFTVVWWEQRGTGLSYRADLPPETMTVDQFVADIVAVTNYLRSRFGKEKIYLMGHSWGSFIGIQAAAQAPQLYYAYIGMAQMSYQLESERLAYEFMLERFKQKGDTRMVRRLERAPVTATGGTPDGYLALRDKGMHSLGIGTTHDMKSVISGIFIRSWLASEYSLREKINLWRGRSFSRSFGLWDKVLRTDLSSAVPSLQIPVYFFHGRYDYTCSYDLARQYFRKLNAPLKGFYTFEHSAHSPVLEEAERARSIFREDVLAGSTAHADTT